MDSKKSIRSGAGPLTSGLDSAAGASLTTGSVFPVAALEATGFESVADLFKPLLDFPFLLASCCAKYCLLFTSKSLSFRYSSREAAKLVGACLILGISSRVACS